MDGLRSNLKQMGSLAALKYLLSRKGFAFGSTRLPFSDLSSEHRALLDSIRTPVTMPTSAPNKATEQEVKRLLKRLARLKGDWPSEPALRDLSPQMVEACCKRTLSKQGRAQLLAFTIFAAMTATMLVLQVWIDNILFVLEMALMSAYVLATGRTNRE